MKKLGFILLLLLLSANVAMAQTFCQGGQCTYVPLEPLPCPADTPNCQGSTVNDVPALLTAAFKLLITLGSLFAIVMIVIAGIAYMLSESAPEIDKAKKRMWAAIYGLLLLTLAYMG